MLLCNSFMCVTFCISVNPDINLKTVTILTQLYAFVSILSGKGMCLYTLHYTKGPASPYFVKPHILPMSSLTRREGKKKKADLVRGKGLVPM